MEFLVNVDVDNLDEAVRFYTAAFVLKVGRRFGAFVELLGGPTPLYLLAKAPGTQAAERTAQRRSYERHWTPVHLDFVVDDIEAAIRRATSAGARLEHPAAAQDWGKLAQLADPFGHGFCFIEFTRQGYDAIVDASQ